MAYNLVNQLTIFKHWNNFYLLKYLLNFEWLSISGSTEIQTQNIWARDSAQEDFAHLLIFQNR